MPSYVASGTATIHIRCEVELADNETLGLTEDEIRELVIERANGEFGGLSRYCGNGGMDKLVGVSGVGESVDIDEEFEGFDKVEGLENEQLEAEKGAVNVV